MTDLPIAGTGPDKLPALRQAIHRLQECGHQRIVMLTREESRIKLGAIGRVFFEELKKFNLPCGDYNMPNWEISSDGLRNCLNSLFQVTPPTAILVDDWMLVFAIQNHLLRQRGQAFRRVVCVSTDYHPSFKWCRPGVAHFYWDPLAIVRRAVGWVGNVAQGKDDRKQKLIKAKFVEDGALDTI